MSKEGESFFTVVGCMDGRVQEPVAAFGREKFGAEYPDTITGAGIVGSIAHDPSIDFLDGLRTKLWVSLDKHKSRGIVINGHAECAGNPVDDEKHREDVRESVKFISDLAESKVPVVGVFVVRTEDGWKAEEI